jgi:glutaredoxin
MKWLIRLFFRTIRRILGPVMLVYEKLTTPRGVQRPAEQQRQLDEITRDMALYQFRTCPFCLKVRREIKRHSLNIELRDAQHDPQHRQALQEKGGQIKVPCLRYTDSNGRESWLYESDVIIDRLRQMVPEAV